ncbi:hypothetical protein ACFL6L_04140 [candidate division KSB1 bacterium]
MINLVNKLRSDQCLIHFERDNPESSQYIVEGRDNFLGWHLYRIPLSDFSAKIGNPGFGKISFIRLTCTGLTLWDRISVY